MFSKRYNTPIKSWRNWKKFMLDIIGLDKPKEKNNQTITLKVIYAKEEAEIYPAYVSKHNSNCEEQVILLTISSIKGWHYLAVIRQFSLLGVTSTYNVAYYCLDCFYSFRTKTKLESDKELCKNIFLFLFCGTTSSRKFILKVNTML